MIYARARITRPGAWWSCGTKAPAWILALALAIGAGATNAHAGEPEVGTTVLAKPTVLGIQGTDERPLKAGSRVHRNELVRTGPNAQVELSLDDNTKLALGPDAELRLDEFVVAQGDGARSIAVRLLKGTLRFLTGRHSSESYRIETPAATIGVRGTIFDVYVAPDGDTFVLLYQGKVEVCSSTRSCQTHLHIGRVIHATPLGVVSRPMKWTENLVRGVGVRQAFPFVGQRLAVDPRPRLTYGAISEEVGVLKEGGKTIERTIKKISPF